MTMIEGRISDGEKKLVPLKPNALAQVHHRPELRLEQEGPHHGADHRGHRERDEEDRPERPAELRHAQVEDAGEEERDGEHHRDLDGRVDDHPHDTRPEL
jgi:hypothetical protein